MKHKVLYKVFKNGRCIERLTAFDADAQQARIIANKTIERARQRGLIDYGYVIIVAPMDHNLNDVRGGC